MVELIRVRSGANLIQGLVHIHQRAACALAGVAIPMS